MIEISTAFQRWAKFKDNDNDIEAISLQDLKQTNEMLGFRDVGSGYRIALQDRIDTLENNKKRSYESYVRTWHVVVSFLIILLISLIVKWMP